ncbi:TetR/AcrR family transcriptional regulator [Streptomyces mangrovisoli]|uniref:TetR family transcriptional regulator n=1 Tax=Streptomyces mangrovisoli TaxID=1428628 RepID=A0A1J4NRL6_9ACTN|nr:TetR family transcriptional regulator [Streptomyces mangrovisoli]OIJ63893.1 TetR family transcriptional regulator [Streptomyces mangrovisoli]
MTSRATVKRVRKAPAERRSEIVASAATLGLTEGLECITLRRVADELGVRPGLVSHYFPVAEELVAEAFADATTDELDGLLPSDAGAHDDGGVLGMLRRFLALTSGEEFDDISRLWLNARHLARYRPLLHEQVVRQELLWCRRIEAMIDQGVRSGAFTCADPWAAAVRILVAVDGTSAYINTSLQQRLAPIRDVVRTVMETELGLTAGTLSPAAGD